MDFGARRFGRGPRELGGSADLISQFKLWPHYESFCKKSIPVSISETRYLDNVVGDTTIRKGQGMELDQLFRNASSSRKTSTPIRRFDLGLLSEAFRIKESSTVKLHQAEKGIPTGEVKLKSDLRQKKKKKKRKRAESKSEQREKDDDPKRKHRDVNKISKEENNSGFELLKGPLTKKKKLFDGPANENQSGLVRERSKQRECWGSLR